MLSDKELKKRFRGEASSNPDKYYPTSTLIDLGFSRRRCSSCEKFFWATTSRQVCGEAECEGGYSYMDTKRAGMSFTQVWREFSALFEKKGYEAIKRYPVIARWNATTHFVIASITDFQPYVVSGEIEPPARKLVVPQICIRFPDLDNIGISGRHLTGFTMIGQHAFLSREEFDQRALFLDYFDWYIAGLGLGKDEFVIHEDVWAGGGNFGPCLEFFSGGLEIGNQVYMMFEQTEGGHRELRIKVLDMGMGQERCAQFTQGTATIYDAVMPQAIAYLEGCVPTISAADKKIFMRFVPFAGKVNVDENDDIDAVWAQIASKLGIEVSALKRTVMVRAALYSIADHTRTLLYALGDGAIPSNVGGGYNLRVLYRRVRDFMDRYGWDIDIEMCMRIHAESIKEEYPEFEGKLGQVFAILDVEERKYLNNRRRNESIIASVIRKDLSVDDIISLHESEGISPDELRSAALKAGVDLDIPDNIFSLITERHASVEQKASTKKEFALPLDDVRATELLYYDHFDLAQFDAKVLAVIEGEFVVLDRTVFYPTSGGQLHDVGTIADERVVDVFKQGPVVVHVVPGTSLRKGQSVHGVIDADRRLRLAQHHTATHIINGAARRVLGEHIWQAGAAKSPEKGRIDITHYDNLSDEQVHRIEYVANGLIEDDVAIGKSFMDRGEAERRFGMSIYQGGAVPGRSLRIVEIPGFDVEACGGTHLDRTGQAKAVRITRTSKIQDGVIRIEFVAGDAAKEHDSSSLTVAAQLADLLGCEVSQVPGRADELFAKWKKVQKFIKKKEAV
ncbi:MAG: alanine--tRNA ligase, partial [Nanoarchaeota archaeon]